MTASDDKKRGTLMTHNEKNVQLSFYIHTSINYPINISRMKWTRDSEGMETDLEIEGSIKRDKALFYVIRGISGQVVGN